MKLKHLLLAAMTATLPLGASAANPNATVNQVRIYINPGHGTYTDGDRPMATMGHGAAGADTAGFYESNTNMQKAYGLLDKLKEYGVPYDPSKSVLGGQTNIRMSHATTGVSPALTTVAAEAESGNYDVFISIHSNANQGDGTNPGGHTNFNQLLFLHRGWDGNPYSPGSYDMAMACWNQAIKNKHMHWNWLSDVTHPYEAGSSNYKDANGNTCTSFPGRTYHPSGKDAEGNPYWIKGDVTFQYAHFTPVANSYTRYYGVLNHTIPGFLVEGYDHTYRPAMHRAMNDDVCRHEGELYARGLNDYFGWGKKDSYGKIYGIVRDQSITMNETYYSVIQNPTRDANKYIDQVDNKKPLNGVRVALYNSSGVEIDSYTTDGEWNGAYFFKKVAPGTYTIKHSLSGYKDVTQEVTVVANETNYIDVDMRTVPDGNPVQGHYAYGLNLTKTDDYTYTASFKSTGAMSDGKIILTNTSTKEQTVILTGAIKKGDNSVAIDATKLGDGVNYTWAVAFDNPQSTGYEQVHGDNSIVYSNGTYNARLGVAIDNDETSANFGTIYTSTGYGQGIQRFNPDFEKNGSKLFAEQYQTQSFSNRLKVNDGKVYLAVYNDASTNGVYVYNPSAPSATLSKIISSSAHNVDFIGEGSNRKMYINANGVTTSGQSSNVILRYDIKDSDSWSGSHSGALTTASAVLLNGGGDMIATDNALIVSQTRFAPNNASGAPAFIVVDQSGNTTFDSKILNTDATDGSSLEGCYGGGIALTNDKSTFAVVEGGIEGADADITVKIYSVKWNGSTPSFTYQYSIPLSGTKEVNQMAFDHADNLYVTSRQQGLLVYAIKNPSRQTVTNGSGTITGVKPIIPLYIVGNGEAVGDWDPAKAVEFTDNGNNYTITLDENTTEFKISTGKGDISGNWDAFDAGNLTTNESITNGGTINLIAQHSYNNFVLPWAGVWNITVSGDRSTLTATTNTPKPLPPLYIVGNSESIGNWDSNNAVEFTDNHTEYTITLDENVTEFKISTNKGDLETFNNGNLTPNAAITNGGKVNLIADKDGENIVLPWAGVWNISVASDLSTLIATTSTPRPLYIVGNSEAIGAWNPNNAVEIANNGSNYSITLDEDVTAFKISTGKGDWGVFDAGNLTYDAAITNGGTVNLIAKHGGDFILPWEGVWNITIANDLSKLTASTSTPDPNVGPGIGAEPENAPNPDAETPEVDEPEDANAEGYFAYGLELTKSGNEYTFNFKSTGARKNGVIVLTPKSSGKTIEIKTPIKKGANEVKINAYDIAIGDYTWAVKINNSANNTVKEVGSDNTIVYNDGTRYARIGVAIDNDQTSANFGTIYTMTARGQGLQKFNADMSRNGSKILTGKFGQDASTSTNANRFVRSNRLEVNNGKVYIANYAAENPGIWIYDPTTNSTPSCISGGAYYERAITFYGEGSSRKAFGTHATEHHVKRFDIGTNTSWTSGSPSKYFKDDGVLLNGDGDIIVTNNAVIVSQSRFKGKNLSNNPAFAVFDHDLNLKYKSDVINSTLNGTSNGGMAISPDYKTFAIINGQGETYEGSGVASTLDLAVQVYNVTWNGSTPTFTHQYGFTLSGTQQVDQMEFDHAGNLLIASREKGLLKYAVKTSARATVTNSTATVTGLGRDVAPSNVVATRKCNGEGGNSAAGTVDAEITWTGEAGDYKIFYQTMRRDDNGNRVADNSDWVVAGTATIASGSTTGKFTHKNLASGDGYARIYNYKVANYYSAANYASESKSKAISGKGRTVTSYPSQLPINVVLAQPTEEKDGKTLYSLDLKLDVALNKDVFNTTLLDDNDEPVKATKYVIVTDEATAKKLNAASNVKEVGRFYRGSATMTANNCNHYTINDWYMIVDFDDVTPSGDLSKATKSLVWEGVDFDYTYKAQVYTSAVRTFNFTASALESATCKLNLPLTEWKANSNDGDGTGNVAEAIPVTGNIIESLAGNEDYPMGTFLKKGDIENPTKPVSITEANVIGAAGCIDPLPVTDDVLNEWDITYTLILKDKEGNVISEAVQESSTTNKELYSNTQKRIVDILGLNVGRDESTSPDGRARYTYNAEKNDNYTLVVRTTYRKTVDGKLVEKTSESEAPITVNPSFPIPELEADNSPGYLFLEEETHWDEKCKDENGNYINGGYFKYFYDVAMDIQWKEFDDNLVRYMGYYAESNKGWDCIGHPVESNLWTPYQAASVIFDEVVARYNNRIIKSGETEDILRGLGYTGTENWSALATEAGHIPVKVHYVWAGNEKLTNRYDASIFWELTANYPVIIYDEPLIKVSSSYQGGVHDISAPLARSAADGKDMYVITTIDRSFDNKIVMGEIIEAKDEISTGVEDVNVAKGSLRLYPNPANSVVTLEAWTVLDDVKVFTVDGQLVKEFEADDTRVKFNVSDLPTGVYIIHAAGATTRMIKR